MKYIILLILLTGCASTPIETIPVIEETITIPKQQAQPITTKEVNFNVISKKKFIELLITEYNIALDDASTIAQAVFDDDISLFTLNAKNYSNLGLNMQEIIRYITETKAINEF